MTHHVSQTTMDVTDTQGTADTIRWPKSGNANPECPTEKQAAKLDRETDVNSRLWVRPDCGIRVNLSELNRRDSNL